MRENSKEIPKETEQELKNRVHKMYFNPHRYKQRLLREKREALKIKGLDETYN
jgi:hypothetical protein